MEKTKKPNEEETQKKNHLHKMHAFQHLGTDTDKLIFVAIK